MEKKEMKVVWTVVLLLLLLSGCGVIQKEEEIRMMRYGEKTVQEDVEIAVVLKGDLVSEGR